MTSTAKYKTSAPNKPKSCWDLFCSFTLMAMQAFGGSTAIAQQFLVDQKKWLTQSEFLDLLTVSQVLPGPNIMILTIMVGDRHFGWRGALASFLGMITLPATLMLSVFVFYQQYAENKWVSDALVGMAASASGMVAGAAGLDFWFGHHIHHRRRTEDFDGLHSADCRYSSLLLGVVPIH